MLIAKGSAWNEFVEQIKATGYTGTTWMVWFDYDEDCESYFFTDLAEARSFAQSITADKMAEIFGDDVEGRVVRVEEDEWENGEFIEIGFCTWYGYEWKNGKWEVYC